MTTFNIKNIAPNLQEMQMTVFYEFSNGNVFSNTIPTITPVTDILAWGQDKCAWFDEREEYITQLQTEYVNETIEE